MKIAPVAEVKAKLSRFIEQCEEEGPIIVTKNGRPSVVMVPIPDDDEELEHLVLFYNPKFRNIIDSGIGSIEEGGGIEHDEFWKEVRKRSMDRAKR